MGTNRAEFNVYYDGEALRGSLMDVRDLAPALLALGDMLEAANRVINGDKATVRVNVKAFQAGCFGIDFEIAQSFLDAARGMLVPGSKVREALEILALLGFTPVSVGGGVGIGLFWLIKKLRGKKPKNITVLEHGRVRVTIEGLDGQAEDLEVQKEVIDLYADMAVRKSVDKAIDPTRRDGIDSLSVASGTERIEIVTKEEAAYFTPPLTEPEKIAADETPHERVLSIVSLSFKEDNKWRLSDGSAILHVKISDPDFLARVAEGKAEFAKGDMLKVRLSTRALNTSEGLKTEYEAVRVLEHIRAARPLFLSAPDSYSSVQTLPMTFEERMADLFQSDTPKDTE